MPEARVCLVCRKPLKGRSDKKFCDDHCRNLYNNQLKSGKNLYIRYINKILKRNRRVLESLAPINKKPFKVSREKLLRLGFSFDYFTHMDSDEKGDIYKYCYDYGYLAIEDNQFQVVRRKEELKTPSPVQEDVMKEPLKEHR